jgi:hypothetical protein
MLRFIRSPKENKNPKKVIATKGLDLIKNKQVNINKKETVFFNLLKK